MVIVVDWEKPVCNLDEIEYLLSKGHLILLLSALLVVCSGIGWYQSWVVAWSQIHKKEYGDKNKI
ncbi:MAG: hypothetical protein ACERKZ_21115 [Lachnotalea sp.]